MARRGPLRLRPGDKSRMSREAPVRFCEGPGVQFPRATRRVVLVPAVSTGYTVKGQFKIPNSDANSWAHPVVIGGRLYLREKDSVWCYDVHGNK